MDEHHHSSRICLCSNAACCVGFGTSSAQLRANQWLGETWWVTEHVFRLVHIMTRVRCILGSRGIGRTWTARANLFHLLERKPEPLSLSILWFFHFGHWVLVSKAKHYIFNPLATKAGLYCCVRPHLMKNARTNHVWFSRLAGFRCKSAKLLQALACCANILVSLWLFPIFGMTTSDLYRKLSLGASRTPSSCSLCSLGSWSTGKTWAVGHAIPVAIFQSPSH